METIDSTYLYCSEISKNLVKVKRHPGIIQVKNVFKDPYRMLKFQSLLTKWESAGSAKPGMMSLHLPRWTAEDIAEHLFDDVSGIDYGENEFYYFYYNNVCSGVPVDNIVSNNCILPHTDVNEWNFSTSPILCTINLNNRDVTTNFWSYKGNPYMTNMDEMHDYYDYTNQMTYDNYEEMMSEGLIKKMYEVSFGFNEAIIYDSRCYHSPVIDKYYTRENPRIMMRLSYTLDGGE